MIKKYIKVISGSMLLGMGISVSLSSALGLDPLSSVYQVVATIFNRPLAFGTIVVSGVMLLVAVLFKKSVIGPGTLLNPLTISLTLTLMPNLPVSNMLVIRMIVLMFGLSLIAFGNSLYLIGAKGAAPYDASIYVISDKLQMSFGKAKIILDSMFVLSSILYFKRLDIAPIIAVVWIGPLIDFFMSKMKSI